MLFHCQSKSIQKFVHSTMQSTSITEQKQLLILASLLVLLAYMHTIYVGRRTRMLFMEPARVSSEN